MIEAGLGGRYDATNVIPSKVQVLTNVGLEHTRWLGPTIADIAEEKLAVVRDHGDAGRRASSTPEARGGRRRRVAAAAERAARSTRPRPRGRPARARRGALPARATSRSPRRPPRRSSAAAGPAGRCAPRGGRAARARAARAGRRAAADRARRRAQPVRGASRWPRRCPRCSASAARCVGVFGVLDDKDAAGDARGAAAALRAGRVHPLRRTRARSRPPRSRRLAAQLGGPPAETIADPRAALGTGARAGRPGRRGARHGLDLPDRRPGARRRRRARASTL